MLKPIDQTPYYNLTGRGQAGRAAVQDDLNFVFLPTLYYRFFFWYVKRNFAVPLSFCCCKHKGTMQ